MSNTEADEAFLERMGEGNGPLAAVKAGDVIRLLALAREGVNAKRQKAEATSRAWWGKNSG